MKTKYRKSKNISRKIKRGGGLCEENLAKCESKIQDLNIEIKLPQSEDAQKIIDDANIDDMGYDTRWSNYRIRVSKQDLKKNKDAYNILLKMAFDNYEK